MTIKVLDALGVQQDVELPLTPGRKAAALSRPVVLSTEDLAAVNAIATALAGSLTVSGTFWQATQPVSLTSLPALVAGTALIGKVGIDLTTPGTTNALSLAYVGSTAVATGNGVVGAGVQRVSIASDNTAFSVNAVQSGAYNITNISGTVSLPTGASTSALQTTLNTNIGSSADAVVANGAAGSVASYLRTIKDAATDTSTPSPVKIDQTTDGTTNRVNAVPGSTAHALIPAPSTYRLLSAAASTNGANIKASAGTIKGIQGFNAKASAVYLKLYNKASSPTVGTDTPIKTIYLPATAAFAFDFGTGVGFATGISIALTGAGADADTTALASGDILALNVDYH